MFSFLPWFWKKRRLGLWADNALPAAVQAPGGACTRKTTQEKAQA